MLMKKVCMVFALCAMLGFATLANAQSDAKSSGASKADAKASAALKVGDSAADFELQSLGKKIKLSDYYGKDGKNAVVVFSRANW